uniref:Uncharacterized protein n=1 Tax=Cannabis sativa TaxID=3483 RepID=A0A803PMX1_CANSA
MPEEAPSTPTHSQIQQSPNPVLFDHSLIASSGNLASGSERGNDSPGLVNILPQSQDLHDISEAMFPLDSGSNSQTVQHPAATGHPMTTRAKACIFKLRVFMGQATWQPLSSKPYNVEEALAHPGLNRAMKEENNALKNSKT